MKNNSINKIITTNNIEELELLVKNMIIKEDKQNNEKILQKINSYKTLTQKCVIVREYLSPQSILFQNIIMNDLGINKPVNEISGDGCKNIITSS